MKKRLLLLTIVILLAGCAPAPEAVQTAIAQTQAADMLKTPAVLEEDRIQTAIVQTQAATLTAELLATQVEARVGTSVVQTLTALPPAATATPAQTTTPLTPVPAAASTAQPRPSITNTLETIIPSGPITITSLEYLGDGKVKVNWECQGSFPGGFTVVWSKSNPEPAYPDDYWVYFGNGKLRSAVVDVTQPDNYFFRVCEFVHRTGRCENYSQAEPFTAK
ncbi:MAG: hypothetical protein IT308_02580 [Anaerolineaceae bacterium]|nr:hypothetical protein [Anaerolineaceae bacterium]